MLAVTQVNLNEYAKCDYYQELKPLSKFVISSPGFPRQYSRGVSCRWAAEAPAGYKLSLNCNNVQMPFSFACLSDQIQVSSTGHSDMADAKRFCGNTAFKVDSLSTRMTISLKTTQTSFGGKFRCSVKAIKNKCTCGLRNRGKIAGGNNTFPNEYPSMAGLVDFIERRIYCGATLISTTYALSAAHCKSGRAISKLGLIVGEHDTEKGSDSNFTLLVRISQFILHTGFNQRTNENDIALVKLATQLTFNNGIQAACLPFKFINIPLVSHNVQAVGWGTLEFAGPQTNILQHVTLQIVNYGNCTKNQICTYGKNKDTCQSDSGGPLYLYEQNVLYIVGIVSYGFECATKEPAVNTKVTAYINWILENTVSKEYCDL
ncbi:hypothetical protein PVAND_004146 [Polypedilum vanderplanki]|uniref:Venom serine protease 34 n=1 Tax=Polypedilum vanderplanki TaxID=319348 RepID=A0A9J6BWQ0_POLVA|nr:hypothetical protein PVAND_004146 [Polypedilum vanderplanki]